MRARKKKRFIRAQAKRIESEIRQRKRRRLERVASFLGKTTNLIFLLAASVLISIIWQQRVAEPYITSTKAVGGDYFNALTYAKFFAEHLPLPPTGWMPFWNGGIPVIGGYPTAFFYLMHPLTQFFDVASSMELLSIIFILLFLISAHFLFWELSRNHILSLFMTGILILTPAIYYALTAEGLVTASAMQWSLPATLFFLIRFIKFQQRPFLVAAGILTGVGLLIHAPMAVLTVFVPAFLYLLVANTGDPKDAQQTQQLRIWKPTRWEKIKTKGSYLLLFTLVSTAIGSIGLYTNILQVFFSAGAGPCESLQCWGEYPLHLMWFSPLILLPVAIYLPLSLIAWRIHKARFSEITALFISLLLLIGYITAARLHLVDSLASAFFPRRFFWAIALLALTVAASAARYISKASTKLAVTAGALLVTSLVLFIPKLPEIAAFSLKDHLKTPNALPMGVDKYIVAKYQTLPGSDILPSWLPIDDNNWRLDSIRPDFFIWWNTVAKMPATRGYSNAPTQEHLNWIYFLQTATLAGAGDDKLDAATRRDRALFLLDAFGINILFQSGPDEYDPAFLDDTSIIKRSQKIRDWTYYELDEKVTTPIVSPTNAARLLVISDQAGYETLMRAIALKNLNSTILIPIKGPSSIDRVSDQLLDIADAVVLYQFTGNQWGKLEEFVKNGGNVFIDIGSLERLPSTVPKIFGAKGLELHDQERGWELTTSSSTLLEGVQTRKFAPLLFKNDPWKIAAPPSEKLLEEWMDPVLMQKTIPVLSQGKIGQGTVIFSGFNLPYHIVSYQNAHEATLLKNILLELIPEGSSVGKFSVKRPSPSSISIAATGSKGVYVKENYHPGWKALVNGKKTPVYKAGLSFMYVPISAEEETNHITLTFRGSLMTWGWFLVSGISLILSFLFVLSTRPFATLGSFFEKKITRRIKTWWVRE